MYEYHYYCWDGTDNAVTQNSFTDSKVVNDKHAGHEVPVLIGEFTLFDQLSSWEYALKTYEENGWSWTTWTYKTVDQGNWGIFNSKNSATPKVNIQNDSYEEIKEKWSKVDTATSFTKNKYLFDMLKTMADPEKAKANPRKWYQDVSEEVTLRAGTDAVVNRVSGREVVSDQRDGFVISLTVTGTEQRPTATSRNVAISPLVRNSVNAAGLDFLTFWVHSTQGGRALHVTLVDKNGATWSEYTEPEAMPTAYRWEKIFLDISKATVDTSAIIEVRIGVNVPGTYYFDDLYFAGSYSDLIPTETKDAMMGDMGVLGTITDWEDVPVSSVTPKEEPVHAAPLILITVVLSLISVVILILVIVMTKKGGRK
jgi:hypothetical protein